MDNPKPRVDLTRVKVRGLFGRFTHVISLNREDRITIIHAPNGYGKTALLSMINAFFNRDFGSFFSVRFDAFELTFSDGSSVEISRDSRADLFGEKAPSDEPVQRLSVVGRNVSEKEFETHEIPQIPFELMARRGFERYIPYVERVGPNLWRDEATDDILTASQVVARYGSELPERFSNISSTPKWLQEFTSAVECQLIETQRLLRFSAGDEEARHGRRGERQYRAVVEAEALDLAKRIGEKLEEYANKSQALDQTFPQRLIEAFTTATLESSDVQGRLLRLNEKRKNLIDKGLLDQSGTASFFPSYSFYQARESHPQISQVLQIYLDDTERKLEVFDKIFERVNLFLDLLAEKFSTRMFR